MSIKIRKHAWLFFNYYINNYYINYYINKNIIIIAKSYFINIISI